MNKSKNLAVTQCTLEDQVSVPLQRRVLVGVLDPTLAGDDDHHDVVVCTGCSVPYSCVNVCIRFQVRISNLVWEITNSSRLSKPCFRIPFNFGFKLNQRDKTIRPFHEPTWYKCVVRSSSRERAEGQRSRQNLMIATILKFKRHSFSFAVFAQQENSHDSALLRFHRLALD